MVAGRQITWESRPLGAWRLRVLRSGVRSGAPTAAVAALRPALLRRRAHEPPLAGLHERRHRERPPRGGRSRSHAPLTRNLELRSENSEGLAQTRAQSCRSFVVLTSKFSLSVPDPRPRPRHRHHAPDGRRRQRHRWRRHLRPSGRRGRRPGQRRRSSRTWCARRRWRSWCCARPPRAAASTRLAAWRVRRRGVWPWMGARRPASPTGCRPCWPPDRSVRALMDSVAITWPPSATNPTRARPARGAASPCSRWRQHPRRGLRRPARAGAHGRQAPAARLAHRRRRALHRLQPSAVRAACLRSRRSAARPSC